MSFANCNSSNHYSRVTTAPGIPVMSIVLKPQLAWKPCQQHAYILVMPQVNWACGAVSHSHIHCGTGYICTWHQSPTCNPSTIPNHRLTMLEEPNVRISPFPTLSHKRSDIPMTSLEHLSYFLLPFPWNDSTLTFLTQPIVRTIEDFHILLQKAY